MSETRLDRRRFLGALLASSAALTVPWVAMLRNERLIDQQTTDWRAWYNYEFSKLADQYRITGRDGDGNTVVEDVFIPAQGRTPKPFRTVTSISEVSHA